MRWKGTVAYDGTRYNGWQSQVDKNTIQDFLEARLAVIFNQAIRIHGSGRTDSGVHAKGHAFHFDAAWLHAPQRLLRALRSGIPGDMLVTSIKRVPDDFHARYSATGKRYSYRIYEGYAMPMETRFSLSMGNRKLDTDKMQIAAEYLIGKHDFSAFAANRGNDQEENPVKTITGLAIGRQGKKIRIVVEGDGFLYKMVRSIAGCLIDTGIGKIEPEEVGRILKSRKRTALVVTAPAKGLCLEKVFY